MNTDERGYDQPAPALQPPSSTPLAPLRVRLAVFAAMAIVAVASIWLIDRRAMIRMAEIQAAQSLSPAEVQP